MIFIIFAVFFILRFYLVTRIFHRFSVSWRVWPESEVNLNVCELLESILLGQPVDYYTDLYDDHLAISYIIIFRGCGLKVRGVIL